jgi:hypothetical protein
MDRLKMSKRGSVAVRTALFQVASMARLHEPRLAEIYQMLPMVSRMNPTSDR